MTQQPAGDAGDGPTARAFVRQSIVSCGVSLDEVDGAPEGDVELQEGA